MLVVSRKVMQWVILDISELVPDAQPIKVAVTEILGDNVRVGFKADPRVKILRQELLSDGAHQK